MKTLIAVILTKNEAHHIADCIASLIGWTDAVVVWDSGSTDETVALAQEAGALVVVRPFDNYAAQRQAALDAIAAEWILFIDADERITPGLRGEILGVVGIAGEGRGAPEGAFHVPTWTHAERGTSGYWVPRRNFIVGRETQGGGFFPDYQLRLLRRKAARYDAERAVHETVLLDGGDGHLSEPLIHYNYANWGQFHRKQRSYAAYEASILAGRGIRPRPHNFVLQPLREFRRRFVTLQGWRDGIHGLRLALLLAWYYGFLPYWLLMVDSDR